MPKPPIEPDPEAGPKSTEDRDERLRAELRSIFARHTADGEDLVQQVYERMLRYKARKRIRDRRLYLIQIARNVRRAAWKLAQKEKRRHVVWAPSDFESGENISRWSILEDGGHEIALKDLDHLLNQLPRECQVTVVRRCRDGWTFRQIADEIGVTPRKVERYLRNAMDHFRRHYSLPRRVIRHRRTDP